jgi:hypothetical protein
MARTALRVGSVHTSRTGRLLRVAFLPRSPRGKGARHAYRQLQLRADFQPPGGCVLAEEEVDKKLWLYAIHMGKDRSEVVNNLLRPIIGFHGPL